MPTAFLYDAEGADREVELTRDAVKGLDEQSLLWVDVDLATDGDLDAVAEVLKLDPTSVERMRRPNVRSRLDNYGAYYQLTVYAEPLHDRSARVRQDNGRRVHGAGAIKVDIVVGDRWIVTAHEGEVSFLESYRAQDKAETMLGGMSPQALAASLLDWLFESYFDAVAELEEVVDRLEDQVLLATNGARMTLGRMTALKRQVSRLRALLGSQRSVFYGLARPDFTLVAESPAAPHYATLVSRYERAVDEVEHLHDLVVGSFELFTLRTTLATNDLVKALTFLTVVIGLCAAVAGIFGMNFETDAFKAGDAGFYVTIAILTVALILAALYVRWQRWL